MCFVPIYLLTLTRLDSLCQAILFLIFGRSEIFINILGFVALGLESTLPIPQLLRYILPSLCLEFQTHCASTVITASDRFMVSECLH